MTRMGHHDVASSSAVHRSPGSRYDGWVGLLVVILARGYVAFFLSLSAMAVLPALGPWDSYLVRSGSMAPHIQAGDVVVAAPFDTTLAVPLGRVMVFADPTRTASTGHEVLLVHRVVTENKNGTYVTQGDANRAQDSTALTTESIRGQGRILVRFVGLPWLWVSNGSWPLFVLWLLLTLAALWVVATSMVRSDRSAPRDDATGPDSPGPDGGDAGTAGTKPRPPSAIGPPTASPIVPRWWTAIKVTSLLCLAVIVIAATMLAPQGASGRFTAETVSAGNTWTSATYGTAQVTSPVSSRTYGAGWPGAISGTAEAANGKILSSVSVTVQDVTDGSYWTGLGWIADPSPGPLPKVPSGPAR
jgi:signal peptidase I